jgi:hypothetical protein
MHYFLLPLLLMSSLSFGLPLSSDSTATKKKEKNYSTTLTTRVHSMGFFSFMGRLATDNPAADFYFNYTHATRWGFQVFKAMDIYDLHSSNNFALGLAFKHIAINKNLTVTPYAGFVLEQSHSIIGHGSDMTSMITTSYKLSKHFTLEHLALFPNLVFERSNADWVNRFRILYSSDHVDVTAWGWLNNHVFDETNYNSAGLSLYYSRIPVTKKLALSTGLTGLVMINTSDPTGCPKKNGVLLSIAATWH